jgi:hypothetical protein
MNQIAWQIFGGTKAKANTFIGGVASTITTSGALATKLGIASNRITNFKIVGSDIECMISGSYTIPFRCFRGDTSITYYNDKDGLVTSTNTQSFYSATNLIYVEFKNLNTIGFQSFDGDGIIMALRSVYTPLCTSLGGSVGYDFVFRNCYNLKLYCSITLATNNAGAPDEDISSVSGQSITARYVTNFTAPNPITNLSVGNVYGTAIQLNFTAPTGSTNAIEFYEVYVNGVYKNNISGSGGYATGLNLNTTYTIEVKPVDIFYNKSTSNVVSVTTANPSYTDADANAYISAATLISSEQESAYKLITDLKTAGLWTKIQALYPFKGTTAAQHKWNAKNPLDTNAAFRLAFTGAATFSNLGYQLNGSSYANTNFAVNLNANINSFGATIVCGTNNNTIGADVTDMGSTNPASATNMFRFSVRSNNTNKTSYFVSYNQSNGAFFSNNLDCRGIHTGLRNSISENKLFINSILRGTGTGGGTAPTGAVFIGASNQSNAPFGYSNQRIQIVIIHEGLSNAEVATLHSIIDTSEAIAGRRTW